MHSMNIPTGYAVLTVGLVAVSALCLVLAGWSRKKAAVSAALGFCAVTSIFVIDVVTDGTVMNFRLALILVVSGVILVLPMVMGVLRRPRTAKSGRTANPPDAKASAVR